MSIIHLLASRNFIVVNKDLARKIGLDEAIMLGELASEYGYWEARNELTEDGFFFSTVENVEKNTTFSQYKQKTAIERLQAEGLLYVDRRGIPAKRYIKLREQNILKLFDNEDYDDTFEQAKKVVKDMVDYSAEFAEVWKRYPKKQGKTEAEKAYNKARRDGVTREIIEAGLNRYIKSVENTEQRYIKNGSTWFHQRCWEDEYKMDTAKNMFVQSHGWDYDDLEKKLEKFSLN